MNIKQLKRWKKIRTKGKFRFILLNGVIMYGFSLAISSIIIREFRQPSNDIFSQFNIMASIIYSVGRSIFGQLISEKVGEGVTSRYLIQIG